MVNRSFPFKEVNGSLPVLLVEVKTGCVSEKAQIFYDSGR